MGDLYSFVLGKELSPNLQLICNRAKNELYTGSEYIEGFQTLGQFFDEHQEDDFHKCFPSKCEAKFEGAELIFAIALILGEIDLQYANMGVVSMDDGSGYGVAKIDHDLIATGFFDGITLRSLSKIVTGEGAEKSLVGFDFENMDLYKLAEAFEGIAKLPEDLWKSVLLSRLQDLLSANCGSLDEEVYINQVAAVRRLILKRKQACFDYSKAALIEGIVRDEDLGRLKSYVEDGFEIDEKVGYVLLDVDKEMPYGLSLVRLWYYYSATKNKKYIDAFDKDAVNNKPISVLEMAVHYGKDGFVNQLLKEFTFKANTIQKAIKAVKEKKGSKAKALEKVLKSYQLKTEL